MRKTKKRRCKFCNKLFKLSDIKFAPDPYAAEIYNDKTKVWACEPCRDQQAANI